MSISLDGYAAGPNQGVDHPLGEGGEQLHGWFFGPEGPNAIDAEVAGRMMRGNGAYIMGRRMFGGGDGSGIFRGAAGGATNLLTTHPSSS
jgi:hypothetical protein